MSSRIIFSGLIALIIFAPVSAGCVYIVTYSAMELLIFSLLLLHLWATDFAVLNRHHPHADPENRRSTTRAPHSAFPAIAPGYLHRTLWLMSPLFLFLLFCLGQMVPLPLPQLAWLSPHTAAVYTRLGFPLHHDVSTPVRLSFTLGLSATSVSLLKWMAYASVFLLASTFVTATANRANWIGILCTVVVAVGFAEAMYGLYQYLNLSDYLLWFRKRGYADCVTGTYINRNHFAGLINLCLPVSAGLFSFYLDSRCKLHHFRSVFVTGVSSTNALFLYFLFLGMVVMVLALIFSMSRMGQFSLVMGAAFLAMLHLVGAATQKRSGSRTMLLVLTVILCVGALWGAWKGLRPMEDRWQTLTGSYDDRRLVWKTTLALVRDFRLTGTGLGTYELAYPPYKPQKYGAILMDHAHNDYLELLSEVGLVGFVPWLSFFLLFFVLAIHAWFQRRNAYSRFLGAGGLVATFALLVHSLADFNLQIPANAMLLFLIMGLTWRVVHTSFSWSKEDGA
jgi:O-antigen ligase